jgi:hypothetical protein
VQTVSLEFILALLGLIAGIAALALVFDLRGKLSKNEADWLARRQLDAEVQALHEYMHNELAEMRRDLDSAHRAIDDLKAATEVVPAPPLPKTRSAGLEDLREQLRAAHREADETDDT